MTTKLMLVTNKISVFQGRLLTISSSPNTTYLNPFGLASFMRIYTIGVSLQKKIGNPGYSGSILSTLLLSDWSYSIVETIRVHVRNVFKDA